MKKNEKTLSKREKQKKSDERLLKGSLIILFGFPSLICLLLLIVWIVSLIDSTNDAIDYYNEPKKEFCSKVCEGTEYKISNNKCICSNGQEYFIEK